MARFDTSGLDETIRDMKRLGQLSGVAADRMIYAGATEIKKAWRAEARMRGYKHTGRMIQTIGYAKRPKNIEGVKTLDIYPLGNDGERKHKDGKPVRNVEKAFFLHYGVKGKAGSRWVEAADKAAEPKAIRAMRDEWDKYLKERGF